MSKAKSLMAKMIGTNGKNSRAQALTDSNYFEKKPVLTTSVPINNLMLSGKLDGGIVPGITQLVGDSRTFKCVHGTMSLVVFVEPTVYYDYFYTAENATLLERYNLFKVDTTYAGFYSLFMRVGERIDVPIIVPPGIFVMGPDHEPTVPVIRMIEKSPLDMVKLWFSNGAIHTVAEDHVYRSNGLPVYAKDVVIVDQPYGTVDVIKREAVGSYPAFDIEVPAPHWYCNDGNGIIHHNTNYCVLNVHEFLETFEDAICLFFDNEFGAFTVMESFGVDKSRVIHIPFENLEELAFELTSKLEQLSRDDKVIIFIDSLSQAASKKEMEDAIDGKGTRDMTRAQAINSLFRIITPMLTIRGIPLFFVNSFYDPIGNLYAEKVIKGGKQVFLSSDTILFVTRSQEKEKEGGVDKFVGWNFNYTIMKSRFIEEKTKFTLTVTYDGGIDKYSGLFELAVDGGFIDTSKKGWYQLTERSGLYNDKFVRKSELDHTVWETLLKNQEFLDFAKNEYRLGNEKMMKDPITIDPETGEVLNV